MVNTETKILIVDDNQQYADILNEFFVSDGNFNVIGIATDGLIAIQIIEREMPDLVLTDIMMPNLDGIGLLTHINTLPKEIRPITIVHTCVTSTGIHNIAIELGAEYCILKPYPPRDLIERIKNIYSHSTTRHQSYNIVTEDKKIDKIIAFALDSYKIPKKLDGYNYLSEAIHYYVGNALNARLSLKEVHIEISRRNNTKPANIERSMRNALLSSKNNSGFEDAPSTLPKFNDSVTSLEFIVNVCDYVKNKLYAY